MSPTNEIKRRVEAQYREDDRPIDDGTDYVGQMTIAFCASDVMSCWDDPYSEECGGGGSY